MYYIFVVHAQNSTVNTRSHTLHTTTHTLYRLCATFSRRQNKTKQKNRRHGTKAGNPAHTHTRTPSLQRDAYTLATTPYLAPLFPILHPPFPPFSLFPVNAVIIFIFNFFSCHLSHPLGLASALRPPPTVRPHSHSEKLSTLFSNPQTSP